MKAKIAENKEGEINPKLKNIEGRLKKVWAEVVKEEIKVETPVAKEVKVNNLDNIKVDLKKGWVKLVKEEVKIKIKAEELGWMEIAKKQVQ